MNHLSAHIGYLYTDLPLASRLAAAQRDGFTAVEHPQPYAIPAAEMRQRLADLGLGFSQVTSGMGDVARGEKGLAALAGREAEFRDGFARALDYACAIGCPFVHPMAGLVRDDRVQAMDTYLGNLDWALQRCMDTGASVLVEAITLQDYFMANLALATRLQDDFSGRFGLLFDSYHACVLGEDPALWLSQNAARIGHIHIADHPGRHEPGSGAIDFDAILQALSASGYRGAIGFEYLPRISTAESLGFLADWRQRLGGVVPAKRSLI